MSPLSSFFSGRRTNSVWALGLVLLLATSCDASGSGSSPGPPPDTSAPAAPTGIPVTVQSDTLGLPGSLLLPDTSAAVPGVVIVHGSGPVTRDGEVAGAAIPPIYKRWAERMADRGLAVLRYDKRSTQPEARRADPRALTFLDFVRDAVAAGRLLRDRAEVDPARIVFVGHSQGGNVAPAAAARLGNAAGAAALAGPALAVDSLLLAQLAAGGDQPGCTAEKARSQFDSLRAGRPVSGLICGAGPAFWTQWIRHSEHVDSVAAALDAPLLALQGRADGRYPGATLARSLGNWRALARTDDASVTAYDGVDHFFLRDGTAETATAPIDDLIRWVRDR